MAMFGKIKVEDCLSPKWESITPDKQNKLIEKLKSAQLDLQANVSLAEEAPAWEVRLIGLKNLSAEPRAVEVITHILYGETHPQILQEIKSYMERNSEFISTEFLFEIATHANEWGARSIAFFMLEKRGVEITNETLLMDILAHITITENQKIRKILNAVKSQGLIDMLVTGSMPHYPQDRPIDPRVSMLVKTTAAERPLSKETIKQVIDNPNFRPEVRARVAMQIKDPELLKKIIFDPGEPSEVKEGAAQAAAGLGMENEIFDRCDDIMIRLTTLRSILPDDVLLVGDAELDKITNQNAIADVVTRFKNEYKFKQVQLPIKLDDDQVKRLMEKITDQRILARLFSTDTYSMVKDIALSCIMDQNVLYELSKNAGSHDTAKAIAKITDQGLLLELAQHHLGHDYNYTNRLDIQSNLFGIFKSISENAKTEELQELAEEGLRKFQGRDAFTDD